MANAAVLLLLLAAAAFAAPAAAADADDGGFPQLDYLLTTPYRGAPVYNNETTQLVVDFNQAVMETTGGFFNVSCPNGAPSFRATVRSPQAWVNLATVRLLLPTAATLLALPAGQRSMTCSAVLSAGAYVSSANGSPSPEVAWPFEVRGEPLDLDAPGRDEKPPAAARFPSEVRPALALLNATRVNDTIAYLSTTWDNRFFASRNGEEAAYWLQDQYQAVIDSVPGASAYAKVTTWGMRWRMPCVVATITGTDRRRAPVVVGAHLDSINRQNYTVNVRTGHAPGANDDASGVAVQLEAFRAMLEGGFRPAADVQLHVYSGEEEGIYGSRALAGFYAAAALPVGFMLQLDQCSYVSNPEKPVIAVYTDHTDPPLTTFLTKLVDEYLTTPWVMSNEDNRAGSDFESWSAYGYRTSYAAEDVIDNLVYGNSKHTPFDVIDTISLAHAMEFGRLSLAFAMELAHA